MAIASEPRPGTYRKRPSGLNAIYAASRSPRPAARSPASGLASRMQPTWPQSAGHVRVGELAESASAASASARRRSVTARGRTLTGASPALLLGGSHPAVEEALRLGARVERPVLRGVAPVGLLLRLLNELGDLGVDRGADGRLVEPALADRPVREQRVRPRLRRARPERDVARGCRRPWMRLAIALHPARRRARS